MDSNPYSVLERYSRHHRDLLRKFKHRVELPLKSLPISGGCFIKPAFELTEGDAMPENPHEAVKHEKADEIATALHWNVRLS